MITNLLVLLAASVAGIDFHVTPEHESPEFTVTKAYLADKRPVVYLYVTEGCSYCKQAEKSLVNADYNSAGEFPFRLIILKDISYIAVESYPTFHWNGKSGKGYKHQGWAGLKPFMDSWKRSQGIVETEVRTKTKVVQRQLAGVYYSRSYGSRMTWPGDLGQHLRYSHGIEPAGMSAQQMIQAHDRAHGARR